MDSSATVLIVERDGDLACLLAATAQARGYRAFTASTLERAIESVERVLPDVAIVNVLLGNESALELLPRIKRLTPDSEVVVISEAASLAGAFTACDVPAFAFVEKPFDIDRLFATVERALERRRMNLQNRRLVWELQTINEISGSISRSLELEEVLTVALQRLVAAFDAVGGSIRLLDELTGQYELRAVVGPESMSSVWTAFEATVPSSSEQMIATRKPIVIEDLAALLPADVGVRVCSCVSLPMFAGDTLLGILTLGSATPNRFRVADERLLGTVVRQIVVAIQNAQLHDFVRQGKRDWERTFDAISDPIAVFDSRGDLLRGNSALAAHLGKPITALRPASCRTVGFCGGGCPQCAVGRAITQNGCREEITLPDGQIFSVTTFPMLTGREGPCVVQVAKNVTDEIRSARRLRQMSEELAVANAQLIAAVEQLKSTQAQLLQAEKLSAIGQLVAGVAHELNNPLTSVIGYAQLLEEEVRERPDASDIRTNEELGRDLRRIAEESERAARIVRNLLAFARRQTAARAAHDIADLFARVVALRAYELRLTGVELVTEFEPALPRVIADAGQIQQALLNLVLNAEQAMRGRAIRRLSIGARFDVVASAVQLFVSDSGHGIDAANLSRIFDPFFTTRDVGEGTGLGLSICYGIIRDHGGHIRVESRTQVGTTFTVLLPALVEDPPVIGEDILVAHGDQGEREFLMAALNGWGHKAVSASSASEALDRYRLGGLQAVLLDRTLLAPALADWQTARRSHLPRVPIVLVSSTPYEETVEQFCREEAAALLVPPLELRALRAAVRAVAKECV